MASTIKVDTIENVAGSGNVSLGSGHNLVVPGNITGSGTLTANTLTTLVGSVTHGTDAGDTRFNLNGPNQYRAVFKHAGNIAGQIGGGGTDDLRFSNAAGAITMQIKDGRVTKPLQPAFKTGVESRNATGSDRVISTTNGDAFNYQTRDKHNVGSHFSETTGRFTCPVAGTYMFYCSLMRQGNNGTVLENRIKKNGALMFARAYADGYTSSYQQSMLVTTTVCAVNDYIEFFIQGTTSIYNDDTYIGGYLLG